MSKKVAIALRPAHALQYSSMLRALIKAGPQHPAFQGMFEDLHDRLVNACVDQLTREEVDKLTKQND